MYRPKGAKGKCDEIFSKIIRSKGYCERCGGNHYLQTAHIIPRRYSATRTDEENAWCLCASCHRRLTDWPSDHVRFITDTIGQDKFEELRAKAESVTKMNWTQELERLKEIWNAIKD